MMLLIESTIVLKIPKMTAIVPPDTPGTDEATPTAAPAKNDLNQFLTFIAIIILSKLLFFV